MALCSKSRKSLLFHLILAGTIGFIFPTNSPAQDRPVWHWNPKKEGLWMAAGALSTGTGFWMQSRTAGLSSAAITALQPSRVPVWDRWILNNYSLTAKKGSDLLLYGGAVLPGALLLLDPAIRRAPQKPIGIMVQAMSLNTGLVLITKHLTLRTRPYTYNSAGPLLDKMDKDARTSFFSGHSASMAALSFGYASIWSAYHPDSPWKPFVWAGAATLPAAMGLLRIQAGKHFLSDVLVGYVVGASCGYFLPRWHRIRRN
jgi:membrane-associated phospholipid phosphatase